MEDICDSGIAAMAVKCVAIWPSLKDLFLAVVIVQFS
ncbi:MAG: hypothetical protein SCARUB_04808 [Candidatus Scalindua rubra]|uniref:Uncharacterized protein n=1 Tax=Candidatus Scalindua rubra TaxID=1872076 RepID=A0A1E3X351_9BACT|nr:MAG: hypothetical protein SCARUB_04808 [Candidatus Scalindua rubra]